ncbi:unnamed protein product [Meloidogyne enterolobii]|uniref:Uncharacterized protein n=1 Tax=Meloidogyne enterolobii TaxID=390850 RepID=A0ACB0ZPD6_MELEN
MHRRNSRIIKKFYKSFFSNRLQQPKTSSIPPPPAPLYPPLGLPIHPLPASTFQSTFLPVRMTMPNTAIPPFQQINNATIFPPSDFSVPPPPIPGVRYGFTSGQRMPGDGIQLQNSTQTNVSTTIEKQDEKSPETAEGQRRQISPGPPGLDEGGSPPPSLEQQQQKSPSSVQISQSIQQPFSSVSPSIMINQQQPKLPPRQISLEEAKEIAGSCQFYKRTGTCNFGERCKFAHDDEHLTFGVQMAMRGVSMPNRGGFRGNRGGSNSVGRAGGARDSPKVDAEGGSGRFEKRTSSRRTAGSDSTSRRLDYDISPVRGGGSEDTSVKGNRDRRYRRTSPQRRRGHSRSRSRDRYSRRRRSSSRSRNGRRRAKSSSSSSSSRSASSVSRSSTPQKDRDRKRSRSRTPTRRRRDYSRQRYRREYYRRRSPPKRRSSSSSSNRRRRRSTSSSSSTSQEKKRNSKIKNSCDTDSGSPVLVLSDETVRGEKNNVTAPDSLPMEENKD